MKRTNYSIWFRVAILAIVVSACAPGAPPLSTNVPAPPTSATTSLPHSGITPGSTITTTAGQTTGWKKIVSKYVTFESPASWNPSSAPLGGGAILELWRLGIPNGGPDQILGFSVVSPQEARPNDIISEKAITIGGKSGFKWIRSGSNYVHYDYITTGYNDQGSFSVEVGSAHQDTGLEAQLDRLVQSIVFSK
jgi:hypothetical protein